VTAKPPLLFDRGSLQSITELYFNPKKTTQDPHFANLTTRYQEASQQPIRTLPELCRAAAEQASNMHPGSKRPAEQDALCRQLLSHVLCVGDFVLPGLEARLAEELGGAILRSENPKEAVLLGTAAWANRSNGDIRRHPTGRKERYVTPLCKEAVCKVECCRFPAGHSTAGHECGTCHNFGHGQMECRDSEAKKQLLYQHSEEHMPELNQCAFVGCKHRAHHCGKAHRCGNCGHHGHTGEECKKREDAARRQTANNALSMQESAWQGCD